MAVPITLAVFSLWQKTTGSCSHSDLGLCSKKRFLEDLSWNVVGVDSGRDSDNWSNWSSRLFKVKPSCQSLNLYCPWLLVSFWLYGSSRGLRARKRSTAGRRDQSLVIGLHCYSWDIFKRKFWTAFLWYPMMWGTCFLIWVVNKNSVAYHTLSTFVQSRWP